MTSKEEEDFTRELDYIMTRNTVQRRGKWTVEEENYANKLVYEFRIGYIPLSDGITMRTFLSKLLNCDPMRISKKFVGNNCIGKQVYKRRTVDMPDNYLLNCRKELQALEKKFNARVSQPNRGYRSRGYHGDADDDDSGSGGNSNSSRGLSRRSIQVRQSSRERKRGHHSNDPNPYAQTYGQHAGGEREHEHAHDDDADYEENRFRRNHGNRQHVHLPPSSQETPRSSTLQRVSTLDRLASLPTSASTDQLSHLDCAYPESRYRSYSNLSLSVSEYPDRGSGGAFEMEWPSNADALAPTPSIIAIANGSNKNENSHGAKNGARAISDDSTDVEGDPKRRRTSKAGSRTNQHRPFDSGDGQQSGDSEQSGSFSSHSSTSGLSDSGPQAPESRSNFTHPMPFLFQAGFPRGLLAHSASVENFWMLVNSGDLPKPNSNVLCEPMSAAANAQARANSQTQAPQSLTLTTNVHPRS